MSSLLESYWDVCYAREILRRLPEAIRRQCVGCQLESLSQRDHTCTCHSYSEQLHMYFEDVLACISEADILMKWTDSTATLEMTSEDRALYEMKLKDPHWRITMKTPSWRRRMIRMAGQLAHLERLW